MATLKITIFLLILSFTFCFDFDQNYKIQQQNRFILAYQNKNVQKAKTDFEGKVPVDLTPLQQTQLREQLQTEGIHSGKDYYLGAYGLKGEELKQKIKEIITKDIETLVYYEIWDVLEEADQNPLNSEEVWLIYLEKGYNKSQRYYPKAGWSREHVWSKSHGDFGNRKGPGTDAHALRAIYQSENARRSNRNLGWVSGPRTYNTTVYEPPDSCKGDVARSIFYMALRWDMEVDNNAEDLSDKPRFAIRDDLFMWHFLDPVDSYELRRNDVVYKYQHNRNPFIDHPELLEFIYGDRRNETWLGFWL